MHPMLRRLWLVTVLLLAAAALRAEDVCVTRPIAPGITYTSLRRPEGPWEIRVLRMRRDEPLVWMQAVASTGVIQGVEALSRTIGDRTREDDYVVAATNADFFVMAGDPMAGVVIGMLVDNGELVMTARGRPGFALTAEGQPRIGVFRTRGTLTTPRGEASIGGLNQNLQSDTACLYSAAWGFAQEEGCVVLKVEGLPLATAGTWVGTVAERVSPKVKREAGPGELLLRGDGKAAGVLEGLRPGDRVTVKLQSENLEGPARLAVGGNPELMRDGKLLVELSANDPRHPRTAIGYNEQEVILITLDGRQTGWSVGMSLYELACLMQELGCTDAINLDGGGSTEAWVRGEVVNRPSDKRERPIADALLLRSRAPKGPLARLWAEPAGIAALAGTQVPLELWATDEWYNPVDLKGCALTVSEPAEGGPAPSLRGRVLTVGETTGVAPVTLTATTADGTAAATAQVSLRVVETPARLVAEPAEAIVDVGDNLTVDIRAYLEDGSPLLVLPRMVRWEVRGEGVRHLGAGVFRADRAGARVEAVARVGQAEVTVPLAVTVQWPVEGFEADPGPAASVVPEGGPATARAELFTGGAAEGTRRCRLTYDLGPTTGTRAAYLVLDRPIGQATKLVLQARLSSDTPAWFRAAVTDATGRRETVTFADALAAGNGWQRYEAALPAGLRAPLVWQSVYVVAGEGKTGQGALEVDDLQAVGLQ